MNALAYDSRKKLCFLALILTGVAMQAVGTEERMSKAPPTPVVASSDSPLLSHSFSGNSLNIAIVASAGATLFDPSFGDPRDRLVNSGLFASVAVHDAAAGTPSLDELLTYDAVLVFSNYNFANPATLGDRLADYVDAGGGVVVSLFATTQESHPSRKLTGRWRSQGYAVIPSATGEKTGLALLGTVHLPDHPLMTGVTGFSGGTSSFRPTAPGLVDSAQRVADWDDGIPLVALREDTVGARVDLGFYPPSDVVMDNYWDAGTDGGQLLANALLYAASRPDLEPGDSDNDGDVDEDDFARFETCFEESTTGMMSAKCVTFDFNGDDLVDCNDWVLLSQAWTAVGAPPNTFSCMGDVPAVSEWGLAIMALNLLVAGTLLSLRHGKWAAPITNLG